MKHNPFHICLILTVILTIPVFSQGMPCPYLWLERYEKSECIANRIDVPANYRQIETMPGTYEDWLKNLPLKEGNPPVFLFDGQEKANQNAHFAVIDMDIGDKNLQQCADAVIRLRAEFLYASGEFDSIHFNFTSGFNAEFRNWLEGYRPQVNGNIVMETQIANKDSSYNSFRAYLESVFMYAGSYSLSKELNEVKDFSEMRIGDVFIEGGFPGHAVIVVDIAVDTTTGKKLFLLAQSFMPAQEMHILRNPSNSELNPWFELDFGNTLYTPEWNFDWNCLMRF